ncbi:hypothetical protein P280DRAFT_430030 [Massarina eburnea CBS 473.64]|uniref:Nucleoporin NUP53 n=1 Tax=Massarina eburnea CBS 473.64 TaxID=1395130 RepID=A0A6A6RW63_9PLEO|nr:hypothetical protein P280DRAFT_430030 [Massarina eburnea CBS 473.64]
MQVHAVPDSERAFDSSGRRLPWAFEFADLEHSSRRLPEERGPFGKARKRGISRSKTPTAKSAEDSVKLENIKAIDDIFFRQKAELDKQRTTGRKSSGPASQLPVSASAPNLLFAEPGGISTSFQGNASTSTGAREPSEVILYGFGSEIQWAAIVHFEIVSGGIIYEEYERDPRDARYGAAFVMKQREAVKALSKSSRAKVNQFVGGDHWIKVTFDSPEAAEKACHYSPYKCQGYNVFAEPYRGTGPTGGDRAIRAQGGLSSVTASPNTISSATMQMSASQFSVTASSATATASVMTSMPPRQRSEPLFRASGAFPEEDEHIAVIPANQNQPQADSRSVAQTSSAQVRQPGQRQTLKIRNAKPVVFLPQEKAFLPAPPRWQQTLGSFPVIGWVVGSGQGIIGDQVPRKEDGSFDSASASLYWRVWYMVDACLGTDFCGVKDVEYDE